MTLIRSHRCLAQEPPDSARSASRAAPPCTVPAPMAEPDETSWLEPTSVEPLTGLEPFSGVGATVAEFWRWGFSDLRTNIVRGMNSPSRTSRRARSATCLTPSGSAPPSSAAEAPSRHAAPAS